MEYSLGDIKFNLVRRERKTVGIKIREGLVEVIADSKIPLEYIYNIVKEKEGWIKDRLKNSFPKKELSYENGEEHYYLGRPYILNVCLVKEKKLEGVQLKDGELNLFIRKNEKTYRKKILEDWYRSMGEYYFKRITEGLHEIFKNENISIPDLYIRKMNRRWGSCHYHKNSITLNLNLIKVNVDLIRYVIMHELCHFKHPNHSKEFYEYMSKFDPQWQCKRKKLNEYSKVL
jgi:predicted metal-dependent hydrolase